MKARKSLPSRTMRNYSTVRRRVANANTATTSSVYETEDPAILEKAKKELDREFDETFFRKPKVLIIGTDIAAMTAGTRAQTPLFRL